MRNKKALQRFHDLLPKAAVPSLGDRMYHCAIDALRDFVVANAEPGIRLEIDAEDGSQPFRIWLVARVLYCTRTGEWLHGCKLSSLIHLDSDISSQVEAFGDTLLQVRRESMVNEELPEEAPRAVFCRGVYSHGETCSVATAHPSGLCANHRPESLAEVLEPEPEPGDQEAINKLGGETT